MKMGICYCEPDVMSRCVADNYGDQLVCDFFIKSDCASRCMHRNEDMNNHCWSPEAQRFGIEYGVVRVEDLEIDEYDESNDLLPAEAERRTCMSCLQYACTNLVSIAHEAMDNGNGMLTDQNYWTIGSGCPEYINENEFMEEV